MCESQSLMLFYQSATRYQEAQYLHDGERIYECAMIYGRYICRNSNDFVALPENLRKSITKNLFKGSQEIFSDAIGWVLETMVTQYWQEFKTTVFAQRKSEDVLTTINNDDSGLNGRLETQDEELNTQYSVDSSQNSLNSHFQTNTDASATKRKSVTSFNPFQFNVILGKGDVTSSMSDFASMAAKRFPPLENNTLSLESSTDEISRPYLTLTGKEIRQSLQHIMSSSGNRFSSFHNIYSPVSSRTVISHSTVCSSVEEVKLNPSTNTVLRRRSVRKNSIGAPTIAGNKSFSGVLSNTIGQTFQKREKCRKKSDLCFPLQIILDHPQCCSILKEHLDREGLSQTLLFFEEIAEFRRIPSYDYMIFRARKIFNIYIHDMAVSPLPVTCEVREKIRKDIEEANIKPTMFVIAYNEVVEYIERFLYPRFQNSSDMRRVVAMLNIQNSINGIIRKHSSMSVDANVVRNVNTLRDILRYQYATKFLKDFCSRTLCSENVLFWLDAENYANLPGSDYMKRVAQKIFKKYIEDESTMQINVSYSTKREIMTNLDRSSRGLFKKV